MTVEGRQFCPVCKNISIDITRSSLVDVPSTAKCGNCDWSGLLSDCPAAISREHFYGVEDIAVRLMHVITASCTGPLTAEMTRMGLFPVREQVARVGWKKGDLQRYNDLVDEVRGDVFKHLFEVIIHEALMEAGKAKERLGEFRPGADDEQ